MAAAPGAAAEATNLAPASLTLIRTSVSPTQSIAFSPTSSMTVSPGQGYPAVASSGWQQGQQFVAYQQPQEGQQFVTYQQPQEGQQFVTYQQPQVVMQVPSPPSSLQALGQPVTVVSRSMEVTSEVPMPEEAQIHYGVVEEGHFEELRVAVVRLREAQQRQEETLEGLPKAQEMMFTNMDDQLRQSLGKDVQAMKEEMMAFLNERLATLEASITEDMEVRSRKTMLVKEEASAGAHDAALAARMDELERVHGILERDYGETATTCMKGLAATKAQLDTLTEEITGLATEAALERATAALTVRLDGMERAQGALADGVSQQLAAAKGQLDELREQLEQLPFSTHEARLDELERAQEENIERHQAKLLESFKASFEPLHATMTTRLDCLHTAHNDLEKAYQQAMEKHLKDMADTKASFEPLHAATASRLDSLFAAHGEFEKALERAAEKHSKDLANTKASFEPLHATMTSRLDSLFAAHGELKKAHERTVERHSKDLADTKASFEPLHATMTSRLDSLFAAHGELKKAHEQNVERHSKALADTKVSFEPLHATIHTRLDGLFTKHSDLEKAHERALEKYSRDLADMKAALDHQNAMTNSKRVVLDTSHKDSVEQLWKVVDATKASLGILERSHSDLVQAHAEANEKQVKDLASTKASFDHHQASLTAMVYNLDKALQDGMGELSKHTEAGMEKLSKHVEKHMEDSLQPHATRLGYVERALEDLAKAQTDAAMKYRQELESTKACLEPSTAAVAVRLDYLEKSLADLDCAHREGKEKLTQDLASTKASFDRHSATQISRMHGLERAQQEGTEQLHVVRSDAEAMKADFGRHNAAQTSRLQSLERAQQEGAEQLRHVRSDAESAKADLEHHHSLLMARVHGLEKAHKDTTDKHNKDMVSMKELLDRLHADLAALPKDQSTKQAALEHHHSILTTRVHHLEKAHQEATDKQVKDMAATKEQLHAELALLKEQAGSQASLEHHHSMLAQRVHTLERGHREIAEVQAKNLESTQADLEDLRYGATRLLTTQQDLERKLSYKDLSAASPKSAVGSPLAVEMVIQDVKKLEFFVNELRELNLFQTISRMQQRMDEYHLLYKELSGLNLAAELGRFEEAICELQAEEACARPTLGQEVVNLRGQLASLQDQLGGLASWERRHAELEHKVLARQQDQIGTLAGWERRHRELEEMILARQQEMGSWERRHRELEETILARQQEMGSWERRHRELEETILSRQQEMASWERRHRELEEMILARQQDLTPLLAQHEEIKRNLHTRCQELEQSFHIRHQELDARVTGRHLELHQAVRSTQQALEAHLERQREQEQSLLLTHHEELRKSVHDRCQELEQNFNIRHQDLDERVRGRYLELDQTVRNRNQALEESIKTQREQDILRAEQKMLEHFESELLRHRRLSELELSERLQEAVAAVEKRHRLDIEELRGLPESVRLRIAEVQERTQGLEDKRRQHEADVLGKLQGLEAFVLRKLEANTQAPSSAFAIEEELKSLRESLTVKQELEGKWFTERQVTFQLPKPTTDLELQLKGLRESVVTLQDSHLEFRQEITILKEGHFELRQDVSSMKTPAAILDMDRQLKDVRLLVDNLQVSAVSTDRETRLRSLQQSMERLQDGQRELRLELGAIKDAPVLATRTSGGYPASTLAISDLEIQLRELKLLVERLQASPVPWEVESEMKGLKQTMEQVQEKQRELREYVSISKDDAPLGKTYISLQAQIDQLRLDSAAHPRRKEASTATADTESELRNMKHAVERLQERHKELRDFIGSSIEGQPQDRISTVPLDVQAMAERAEERMANMLEAEVAMRCMLVADLHTRLGREVAVVSRHLEIRAEELASRIDSEANARKDSFAALARGVVRAG